MLTICAVVLVTLLWWIGRCAYRNAVHVDPFRSQRPDDRSLGWKSVWVLGKMPDSSGTEEEWVKWYEQYRSTINAK
jgi:hypothetical protein